MSGPEKSGEGFARGNWLGRSQDTQNIVALSAAWCVEQKAAIILISFHGTQNNSQGLLLGGKVCIPLVPHLMQRRIFITPRPKVPLLTGSFLTFPTALPFWNNVLVALEEERKEKDFLIQEEEANKKINPSVFFQDQCLMLATFSEKFEKGQI